MDFKWKRILAFLVLFQFVVLYYNFFWDSFQDYSQEFSTFDPSNINNNNKTEETITIAVATDHWLGNYGYDTRISKNCPGFMSDSKLQCEITSDRNKLETAQGLWFHIPHTPVSILKRYNSSSDKLLIGFSMEPSSYYPMMDDPTFMAYFDFTMSYRLSSDIITHFFSDKPAFHLPPRVPFEQKKDSVAYINRNCYAKNGRNTYIQRLMQFYTVDSYGDCLNNQKQVITDKIATFSQHKFCISIENSNSQDYVSEKIWNAFEAGCLPIYEGAPNIVQDFLPAPDSALIIDMANLPPAELAAILTRLASNQTLYEKRMEWRNLPTVDLSLGFQHMVKIAQRPRTECQLCQKVAKRLKKLP